MRPLGEHRENFVKDVRKLYSFVREQEYEDKGQRLPVGEILTFAEERTFGEYLFLFASCLTTLSPDSFHIFNINSSKSLRETIYDAFIKGNFK